MKRISKNLKQRWVKGAIVEIDLMDGTYTYALLLEDPEVAFFDIIRSSNQDIPSLKKILDSKILFRIGVYSRFVNKDWPRIGKVHYDPALDESEEVYIRGSGKITIWRKNGTKVPGTEKDIEGMEYLSVWQGGAVEQRLRDHFAGRPCWYLENKKLDWKPIGEKEFYAQYGYDFHWLDEGFDETTITHVSSNPDAIKGQAQIEIDRLGGAQSKGGTSSNKVNSISQKNPKLKEYIEAAKKEF